METTVTEGTARAASGRAADGSIAWAFAQAERSFGWSLLTLATGCMAFAVFWVGGFGVIGLYGASLALGLSVGRGARMSGRRRFLVEAASWWMTIRPAAVLFLVSGTFLFVARVGNWSLDVGASGVIDPLSLFTEGSAGPLDDAALILCVVGFAAVLLSGLTDGMWSGRLARRAGVPVWKTAPFLAGDRERLGRGIEAEMESRARWLRGAE